MRVFDWYRLCMTIVRDYGLPNTVLTNTVLPDMPRPGAVFVNNVISLNDLIHKNVYAPSGNQEGAIENIMVDPASGIVRFATIKVSSDTSVLMPWAAMVFTKSKSGFVLTHRGEAIMRRRGSD